MRTDCTIAVVGLSLCLLWGSGVNVAAAQDAASQGQGVAQTEGRIVRVTEIIGTQVFDPQSQRLGTIKDIVIEVHEGCPTLFLAMAPEVGDLGPALVVMPYSVLEVRHGVPNAPVQLVLNIQVAQLREAPRVEHNHWESIHNQEFRTRVQQFYQRVEHTAARPTSPDDSGKQRDSRDRPDSGDQPGARPDSGRRPDFGDRPGGRPDSGRRPDAGDQPGDRRDFERRPDSGRQPGIRPDSGDRPDSGRQPGTGPDSGGRGNQPGFQPQPAPSRGGQSRGTGSGQTPGSGSR